MKNQRISLKFKWIPLKKIEIDGCHLHDAKALKDFLENFDIKTYAPLVIVNRDRRYYVLDGHLRYRALQRLEVGGNFLVACFVLTGLTPATEAAIWRHLAMRSEPVEWEDLSRTVNFMGAAFSF